MYAFFTLHSFAICSKLQGCSLPFTDYTEHSKEFNTLAAFRGDGSR